METSILFLSWGSGCVLEKSVDDLVLSSDGGYYLGISGHPLGQLLSPLIKENYILWYNTDHELWYQKRRIKRTCQAYYLSFVPRQRSFCWKMHQGTMCVYYESFLCATQTHQNNSTTLWDLDSVLSLWISKVIA